MHRTIPQRTLAAAAAWSLAMALVAGPQAANAQLISWTGVAGNGVFNGTVGSVNWTLTVTNARSAAPSGADPTLLSATNFAGQTATYSLVFDQAVEFLFFNDARPGIGGLAGAGGKQESTRIVGGVGNFSLAGNGANITPSTGSSAVDAVLGSAGGDLTASWVNGVNHAYFQAQTIGTQSSITWQQHDVQISGELWRVQVVPEPATLLLVGMGGAALLARRKRRTRAG